MKSKKNQHFHFGLETGTIESALTTVTQPLPSYVQWLQMELMNERVVIIAH